MLRKDGLVSETLRCDRGRGGGCYSSRKSGASTMDEWIRPSCLKMGTAFGSGGSRCSQGHTLTVAASVHSAHGPRRSCGIGGAPIQTILVAGGRLMPAVATVCC